MTTFNDQDYGPSHAWLKTRVGQVLGTAQIEGKRAVPWARGRGLLEQPVDLYVAPWQGLGGNAANTRASLLYLLAQLEELCGNADLQPIYIGWTTTAFPSAFTAADSHDGWYIVTLVQPNYRRYVVTGGIVTVPVVVSQVAPAAPSSISTWFSGAALASTFSGLATALVGAPLGASVLPPTQFSRTGGEGVIPLSLAPVPNPVPWVRPGTVAGMFQGGVRVFDTINTGSNPVPTAGAFSNANWVQVYGTQHDFVGDCVVTNGLLLLLFQPGTGQLCTAYLWNTQLGTPAWQSIGMIQYLDNAVSQATLREVNLDGIGLEEARVRVRASTPAGNWGEFNWKLQRGTYHAGFTYSPLTQSSTGTLNVLLNLSAAAKISYDEASVQDLALTSSSPYNVLPGVLWGFGAAFGTQANGPLYGFLYQNPPATGQPAANATLNLGFGDTSGPLVGTKRQYGFFAVPFPGAIANLQAEGESGALGTGWSSVANANASGGNEAKAASGTVAGNADLFGTSWVPPAGVYAVLFRLRVTSAAGSAAEMTVGLWDTTAAGFVAGASVTLKANQCQTTYGTNNWLLAASAVTPPAGHNVQFRAVTALTLGTDWFVDEAVLVPLRSATLGLGNFPGDIWSQFLFDASRAWQRG